MLNYLLLTSLIIAAVSALFALVRQNQMLQQNSYFPSRYFAWVKDGYTAPLALECIGFSFSSVLYERKLYAVQLILIIAVLGLRIFFAVRAQKKSIKKLVFTARIKRLFASAALILFICVLIYALFPGTLTGDFFSVLAFSLAFISPLLCLLCRFVTAPVDKADTRWYINDAKRILKEHKDLTVIGITGSYGKTSVKYFLNEILKQRFNVLMTPGNYNTPMGVVKTVRSSLRGYHEIFICEMGARRVGEIKELCDIASPKYGIVTSVGPQHLETFKSIDNIIKTKLELANNLQPGGAAFINADNEYLRDNMPAGAVTYGTREDAAYSAVLKSVSSSGTQFSVRYPDGSVHDFATQLVGAHNVTNLCGAIAMAHYLDVDDKAIYDGVCRISPVPHRLQLIKKPGMIILDDAYNSNPSGCRAALDTLSRFDGMKILVTPGMVELGSEEERLNREFGSEAAAVCDLVIHVGRRQAVPIVAGLHDAGYPDEKIFVADTIKDAMDKVYSIRCEGAKIVLLENDLPDNY